MENTLLYSFSTIPQIVAAMVAITAVFVMFRIEILHKRIMGFGQRILDELESLEATKTKDFLYDLIFSEEDGRKRKSRIIGAIRTDAEKYLIQQIKEIAEMENQLVESGNLNEIPRNGFNTQVRRVTLIANQKLDIISKLKKLIIISSVAILFPLLCLIMTPIISESMSYSKGILFINFLLAIVAVVFTGNFVWKAIFDSEYEGL